MTNQLLLDYLKQTNSNLQANEQAQFLAIASTFNLNPWKREVYAIAYGSGDKRKLSIIVGYEVYLRRAEEFPQYDGYETTFSGQGADMCCTCKVYRKDRNHPTTANVYLREYTQGNTMWNTKPRVMLEKVAIATAMRRAFPSVFNGMPYTSDELPDEMTGADKLNAQGMQEVPQEPQTEAPKEKPKATKKAVDAETQMFLDGMRGLWEQAPDIYSNAMKIFAYKSAANVPPDRRQEVFNTIQAEITKNAQNT